VNGLKQLIFDDVPDRYFMARLKDKVDCERIIRAAGVFELSLSIVLIPLPMLWKMRSLLL